ncbi:Oligosaccharyltransferase subunit Ribophorin II [Gracilaria domingensis]|nr:Oligosaccharyltransferase subunit Ribophorin II [Gracilaria domingensis]
MAAFVLVSTEPMHFEKAFFKASYVQGGERVQRLRVTTDRESLKQVSSPNVQVAPTDSIVCQASFLDDQLEPAAPNQVFFRFVNKDTGKDNFYLLRKKGRDFKVDVKLPKEIKADLDFWRKDSSYRVQLVMGDFELDPSETWTITDSMTFSDEARELFNQAERGVFDFDISVKKSPLPEFISPIPAPEKRAHPVVILFGLLGVTVPVLVLLYVWVQMGVFPLNISGTDNAGIIIGFEACVLCHIVALVMFWVKWNIVVTWKVMAFLMMPTYWLGRQLLSESSCK